MKPVLVAFEYNGTGFLWDIFSEARPSKNWNQDRNQDIFYLMINQNGNKRIAIATLLIFLYFNDNWIPVDPEELYQFTVWIASSPPKAKAGTLKAIEDF